MSWLLFIDLAEAKKKKDPPPPPQEWAMEEGMKAQCWYPPVFEGMAEGDRKLARQASLEAMKAQWLGQRDDGVKFEDMVVDDVETVLLGRPQQIESIARANLELCKTYMKGGDLGPWSAWLSSLPGKLTEGECLQPLTYTLFDYLDIARTWQRPITLCQGDVAKITATIKDRYRISDKGEWINVEGTAEKAIGADYPCNIEGCMVGMLVGRFVTEKGVEIIFPIGAGTTFTAAENGEITWSINDTTWYDNKYFKSATIEDRTAVTIEPGP